MPRYAWGDMLPFLDSNTIQNQGRGVKVALLDTGVDFTHPALAHLNKAGHCFDATGEHLRVSNEYVTGNDAVFDNNGTSFSYHGSELAGILAGWYVGDGDNQYLGIAPGIDLYIFKVSTYDNYIGSDAYYHALAYAVYGLDVDIICSAVYPFDSEYEKIGFGHDKYSKVFDEVERRGILYFQCLKNANLVDTILDFNFPANQKVALKIGAMSKYLYDDFQVKSPYDYSSEINYLLPTIDTIICHQKESLFKLSPLSASYATAVMAGIACIILSRDRLSANDFGLRFHSDHLRRNLKHACLPVSNVVFSLQEMYLYIP